MGKKSKKGQSRAGRTARPAAGQGRNSMARRSKSVSSEASIASRDTMSIESGPPVPKKSVVPPSAVHVVPENKENDSLRVSVKSTGFEVVPKNDDAVAVPKVEETPAPAVKSESKPSAEKTESVPDAEASSSSEDEQARTASTPSGADVWSSKLRDAVTPPSSAEKADGPDAVKERGAVLEATPDDLSPAKKEPVVKERVAVLGEKELPPSKTNLVDLSAPAKEEAGMKQKDCSCVIL